jgi:hypothetical protein
MTRNQEIEKAIAELAEHGRVAVVESSRDCDGVQVFWLRAHYSSTPEGFSRA